MKQYIAVRIERGWDKQRIIDGLVDEFGEDVLATPAKSGFDLIAWLVPGLLVLVAVGGISLLAWHWSRRRPRGRRPRGAAADARGGAPPGRRAPPPGMTPAATGRIRGGHRLLDRPGVHQGGLVPAPT